MELVAYICSMLVGISLGTLGSGGSILTVPIMVYMMGVNPVDATGYSLFVVGVTSTVGAATYVKNNLVNVKAALVFAIPSIVSVFLTRKFIMPSIPNPIISTSSYTISKELFIMFLFAFLMILVAFNMIKESRYKNPSEKDFEHFNYPWLVIIGFVSGFLTGLVGVGGGFIIIPALVLFAKIPIRMSVGTSLIIIAANSFMGFAGEVMQRYESINYKFLMEFVLFSVTGIFIGFRIASRIPAAQLKKAFGWFVLVMGIYIIIRESGSI